MFVLRGWLILFMRAIRVLADLPLEDQEIVRSVLKTRIVLV